MSNTQDSSLPVSRVEASLANAQEGIACWSRAYTQVAQGLMNAGLAQLNLATSMCAVPPSEWERVVRPTTSHEALHRSVHTAQSRLITALKAYRQINDTFASELFAAADSLLEGMPLPPAELMGKAATTTTAKPAARAA